MATHTAPAIDGISTAFSQTADTANAATKAIQDYNAMAADYDKRWGTGAFATYKATGQTGGTTTALPTTITPTTTGTDLKLADNQFYDPNTKSVFTVDPAYIPLYTEQIISQGPNQPGITGAFPALTPTTMAEQTGWGSTPRGQQWLATANIQALQGGGIISKAGLFNLHAGEAVVPAGDNYSYGGINISINNPIVRNEADIDELAKKVGDKIKDAISRRVRLV